MNASPMRVYCPNCEGELWARGCVPECPNMPSADREAWESGALTCDGCGAYYGKPYTCECGREL